MRYEYALRTLAGMRNPYEAAKHRHFAGIWNDAFREAPHCAYCRSLPA